MASEQQKQMNALYVSIKERSRARTLILLLYRDIAEKVHLAATEPEAVTYAEVDAGGVPALWCIPARCDPASTPRMPGIWQSMRFKEHAAG